MTNTEQIIAYAASDTIPAYSVALLMGKADAKEVQVQVRAKAIAEYVGKYEPGTLAYSMYSEREWEDQVSFYIRQLWRQIVKEKPQFVRFV